MAECPDAAGKKLIGKAEGESLLEKAAKVLRRHVP